MANEGPPRLPALARVAAPLQSHNPPESMGEDGYLHYGPTATSTASHANGHARAESPDDISENSHASHHGLTTAAVTPAGHLAARSEFTDHSAHASSDNLGTKGHQVGQPIGLLAARGTPYAKKPLYRSRKCKILCPILGLITLVVTILLTVFPIIRAIATHTLSVSVLHVYGSNITNPTNNSFGLTLEGQVKKAGIFPARIAFTEPVKVYWIAPEALDTEIELGNLNLAPLGVAAGHGRIKQLTRFEITDPAGFARFTEYLITQEAFTWRLKSNNVQAKAFGFIPASKLNFVKDLTLPGMANMTDISISDFQLPGDDPAGGISLAVTTKLTNPSPFGVELGSLAVGLYYNDLFLGPAVTAAPINLTAGVNYINLVGRLVDRSNDTVALNQLSILFSNYLNGRVTPVRAVGLSATLANGQTIDWLSRGIRALVLDVPLSSPIPIQPITSIAIEALSLGFTPETSFSPAANSSALSATFGLPFGFSLDIVQLENSFSIVNNRSVVAGLKSPMGKAATTILTKNAGATTGSIRLDLPLSPLIIGPSETEHLMFSQFTTDLTSTNGSAFYLVGDTSAVTNTPLGQVKLDHIAFRVPAGLIGLSGLRNHPTTILSVDVLGGTPDALILAINVGLTNPSNLDLDVGNVTFQLYNGKDFLGTTVLPNLHLVSGYQEIAAVGYFQANANPTALSTLNDFAQGKENLLGISGFNGSTDIKSLDQAFMSLHLNATLKGLSEKLLNYANVTILPSTGVDNNFANSVVSLQNPFSAPLRITNIQSNITAHGFFLGSIVTNTDFTSQPKIGTVSPVLDFNLNLFPPDIFALLRALVVDSGTLDPAPLDGIVALGGYEYSKSTEPSPVVARRSLAGKSSHLTRRGIYTGFDLPSYVLTAFKSLRVDVNLLTVLHIGDFVTDLSYTQNVVANTDQSLTMLLPVLARPIVQKIVDAAALEIATVMIRNPTNSAFSASLVGAITNAGPFDAVITFPRGLNVAWNGNQLGSLKFPNVSLVADVGATLNLESEFVVTNLDHLTEFTGYLLTEPSFIWQISGQDLAVSALGIVIDGISISKNVVLDGLNGLRGGVRIDAFDLPSNDPAGGVTLQLATTITNPSSVGISLSTIGFQNFFGATNIGPAASAGAFDLTPKSTISLPLAGRLIPQTTQQGLDDVSNIFNAFVHGVPSELVVRGESAGSPECSWLNAGIKKLAVAVVLPASNLRVINSISLNSLTLMFDQTTPYAPLFSTNDTVAGFQLPFAFPVDITQAQTSITTSSKSGSQKRALGDFASLEVPMSPAKTDVIARRIALSFQDVPFRSSADNLFSNFLAETTNGESVTLGLTGFANTLASTAIGNLNLVDIQFSVDTSLLGLQGLNARPATISDLDVARGFSDYLQINVNAALFNPSNITIGVQDVAFDLIYDGQTIGTANILGLILTPGANVVATQVQYSPQGSARPAGQQLLERFVQGTPSDTTISGGSKTTPIASLSAALASIRLATTIPPITQNLITEAQLSFDTDIGMTGVANAKFILSNPFSASINLISVVTNATYEGIVLGQINQQNLKPPINAPGKTAILSPILPLALNTDPRVLIQFIQKAAAAQGVDLGILQSQFDYVLSLASTESSIITSVNTAPEQCNPTGTTARVQGLILAAVKNLRTNLTIESTVGLDEYVTPLNFYQNQVSTVLDDSVLYLTGIIGKTIVDHIVTVAELSFSQGMVTNLTDSGFTVALKGSLLNVGPFDASIEFPEGLDVIWQGSRIATIALPPICNAGGVGVPALETVGILTITDQNRFADFGSFILNEPEFQWTVTTDKLRVLALGTIFDNVSLSKNISFKAFDGLPGVTIVDPDFPTDAPNGIALVTNSLIPSLSNLGIELGNARFIASFEDQEVGPIDAFGLTLAPLAVTSARLTGTIIKRTSAASTSSLGHLFSDFLAGKNQTLAVQGDSIISPAQPDRPVQWLSAAFKKLTLQVVLPGHVYEVISAVKLQDLTVSITKQSEAYSVPTRNNRTDAIYKNPFGFSLTAKQAGGNFFISRNGIDAGVLTLPVTDAVSAETSNGQNADLVLNWKDPRILQSLDTGAFNNFFNVITNSVDVPFLLHGVANVTAGTNAGDIPITGLPFNVSTNLLGLQSLNARPTIVSNLDVFHGFPEYLQINADASIFNPSTITLITTDIVFGLSFQGQLIGSVVLGDLLLIPDANNLATEVRYAPTGGASTVAGELLLANYVQGIVSNVSIVGTPNSSPYGSLQEALQAVSIQTTIPPLRQALITKASLSFPIDVATTGLASASFDLSNPFTAAIHLVDIAANATYREFFLGRIDSQNLSPEIIANGKQNITSRKLPFMLTTDPKLLIQFIEAAARDQGVNLGILLPVFDYVLSLPSTVSTVNATVNQREETCSPTGTTKLVQGLIIASVANLRSDLAIQSTLRLDDFQTNLNFVQNSVPTDLDDSVLYLTGLLGKTIVSNIVDLATLSFSGGSVTNITDNGFTVSLVGSLLNAGPFDALIAFPFGLDVIWQGSKIANIALPPICSPGGSGVPQLETVGVLSITDQGRFADFAAFILLEPEFDWVVTTERLRVFALGTIFDNVALSKNVTFQAFNKLAPGVTVLNPDFPGDAPNGIRLSLDSLVPSPSNLDIDLGDITFLASFAGQPVGPVNGKNVVLPAKSTTALPLTGTIVYTESPANLAALGALFSQFLAGKNSTLQVTGDSVASKAQPGRPVGWLSAGFKKLTLDVILPGQKYEILSSVKLNDLTVFAQNPPQSFAPLVTNNRTDVVYKNPFGFSLTAVQAGGDFIINWNGVDAGLLTVPVENVVSAETSTGNDADLVIQITRPAVLSAINQGALQSFFSAVTNTPGVAFVLRGSANVTAATKAGDIPIGGIEFEVPSTFPGINGFGRVATIPATPIVIGGGGGSDFSPSAGGSDFLRITLDVILANPAPLILHTNLVSFQVIYQGYVVGRAYINPLDLMQGSNTFKSEFHYDPADAGSRIAQDLLTQYLSTKGDIPLTVQGDRSSSPYGVLQEALSEISIPTSFPGQGLPLINDIVIYFDLFVALCNGTVNINTRINNHLATNIDVLKISSTAGQDGTQYAAFDYTFKSPLTGSPDVLPGPYSEIISPVFLTQGALGSIILLATTKKGLDVDLTSVTASIGGYVVPSLQYSQKAVPYTIIISIGKFVIGPAALGQLLGNPAFVIQQLFADLKNVASCAQPGHLNTLISGLGGLLTRLPGFLIPLIDGAQDAINDWEKKLFDLDQAKTALNTTIASLTAPALSAATSLVAVVTSDASRVVSSAGSIVSAVVSPIATVLPSVPPVATVVPALLSVAAAVPGLIVPAPAQSTSPVLPTAARLAQRDAPAPAPTSFAQPLNLDDYGGVHPQILQQLLKKHGLKVTGLLDQVMEKRRLEDIDRVRLAKRAYHENR